MESEKQSTEKENRDPKQTAQEILELVALLCVELYPGNTAPVTMQSDIIRDLGLDSLGRAELFSRIQDQFKVTLSEEVLTSIRSPEDLLSAVLGAETKISMEFIPPKVQMPGELSNSDGNHENVSTLVEMLEWHVHTHPDRPHIYLYEGSGEEKAVTYAELLQGAQEVAGGLRELGLQPSQPVALMLPTGMDYFLSFLGVLLAGGIAVPLYPPANPHQLEDHLKRQTSILNNSQAPVIITINEAKRVGQFLKAKVETLKHIVTVNDLCQHGANIWRPNRRASDIAFLQYTSGSTGTPKGVIVTHAMLLANIRAMAKATGFSSDEVMISWLPLYHDMGLIGAWLGSLCYAAPFVVMSPLAFLSRPSRWLWAIHHHRGTMSASPNFGYELCLNKIKDEEIQGLDLSSWKFALNGAEPVSPKTLYRFSERFESFGFNPKALMPCYGLAETTVGLSFTPTGWGPMISRVKREPIMNHGKVIPASPEDETALSFVSCGPPVPGTEVRIVDEMGEVVGEYQEGRLQFRGPSCTTGYYRNEEATQKLFHGQWLDSGDYAYISNKEIYITGRAKEIIIRAGRNIYPYVLEEAVGNVTGVRKGRVAVFGSNDPKIGTEKLIVLAETKEKNAQTLEAIRHQINTVSVDLLGAPPDEIILAQPNTLLKTSSGKMRRAALRDLHQKGMLGKGSRSIWKQILRLSVAAIPGLIKQTYGRLRDTIYAGYWWFWMLFLGSITWTFTMIIPGLSLRKIFVRMMSRFFLLITRVPLKVNNRQHLTTPSVIVSNHGSYLDGLILYAAFPQKLSFVAKRELASQFVAGNFLKRIGSFFVDRFDLHEGAKDTDNLMAAAASGQSLVFFPEGTFQHAPGLLPFHMGAFMVAAKNELPVVPVGLVGSRSLFPGDTMRPHRGALEVTVGEAIHPNGTDWTSALDLNKKARIAILELSEEPDLEPSKI